MKNRKKWVAILAGIMAAVMVLSLILSLIPAASAASSSEIKQQINELKNQKDELQYAMDELKSQFQENEDEIANIVAKKNLIDQEIFLLHAEIRNINEQISAYNLLIADKQDELDEANAHMDELSEKYKERIRAMEEEGSLSYWAVLFKSSSFADLLDRLNMIEEIAAADQRRLQEMNEAADAVIQAQEALETEKAELEVTKIELDNTQLELDAKREEADGLIAELLAKGAELEELQEEFEAMENQLLSEIAQKEQEYNQAKNKEWQEYMATYTTVPPETTKPANTGSTNNSAGTNEGANSGNNSNTETNTNTGTGTNSTPSSGASWLVPCSYRKLTSPYGWREPPTSGASSFHQGVDLAGPEGTPIYASRSGVVTTATYSGSGGYYVTINHGDGFSSSYLHMTNYVVSAGQAVSAGQLIGYMGNTGISTGPHLHFAIYYNGSSVNPCLYVNLS